MLKQAPNRQASPTMLDGENILMRQIAEKSREAFEELYYLYHRRLVSFLLRITRRPDLVEDILNDAMLTVWEKAGDYRHESRPSTWIFGIAYRKALKSLRRQRVQWEEVPESTAAPAGRGPEALFERKQIQLALQEALEKLSAEQRAVVELTYFHGYSYPEIAAITGCPVNTVKSRMFHARRRLKELLPRLHGDIAAQQELERWP